MTSGAFSVATIAMSDFPSSRLVSLLGGVLWAVGVVAAVRWIRTAEICFGLLHPVSPNYCVDMHL